MSRGNCGFPLLTSQGSENENSKKEDENSVGQGGRPVPDLDAQKADDLARGTASQFQEGREAPEVLLSERGENLDPFQKRKGRVFGTSMEGDYII